MDIVIASHMLLKCIFWQAYENAKQVSNGMKIEAS